MTTTFDPEELPPVYDDRPVLVVKEKNPANQKRGRNSRRRGHQAEREWVRHISVAANRAGLTVQQMPELRGSNAKEDVRWIDLSFELKSIQWKDAHERWLAPGALKSAWEKARLHCEHRTPVVVVCARRQGVLSRWRVYDTEDGEWVEGHTWISNRILALKVVEQSVPAKETDESEARG